MGANLALNMADHGFKVAVYNRTTSVTQQFIHDNPAGVIGPGGALVPAAELQDFVASIKRPRRIVVVDGLPKTATGKVQRFALRQQLATGTSRPA